MRDVFFLTCGTFRAPALALSPPARLASAAFSRPISMSNTVAVAVRDSGDVALVDVGWSAALCADPVGILGRVRAASLSVVARAGNAVVDQLRALGIEASRVKHILATHFHLDHIGGASDFPNAEVLCTARELAAYHGFPRDLGYRTEDLARTSRIRAIGLDAGPTYGFPASADVYGDGEVVLLDARGHTPGHVAVALRTRDRCFVHVGDAVYQSWEYGLSPGGPSLTARVTSWRTKELKQTYARLRSCEVDPRKPTIVPSHDMTIFDRLPHAPTAV